MRGGGLRPLTFHNPYRTAIEDCHPTVETTFSLLAFVLDDAVGVIIKHAK
jgi:hypothetical protein